MTIPEMPFMRKGFLETLILPAIVLLVGVGAFGLGRLSALGEGKTGLVIHPAPTREAASPAVAGQGEVLASKNGTRYYYPWCSGVGNIKEENKVWFNSVEDARAAGYTPAANCAGLE